MTRGAPDGVATLDSTGNIPVGQLGNASGSSLRQTAVVTATHSAIAGELVRADISSGSFQVNLPTAPANGTQAAVKVVTNAAGNVNALTVATGGSDVINKAGGVTSMTLTLQGQAILLEYNAGIWALVATDDAATQLATSRQGVYYLDTFTGTDDQKMTSGLAAVISAGGGTITLSARAHTFANQWSTSYTGTTPAIGIRIIGAGSAPQSDLGNTPGGATSVTFTYNGAGAGQVDFQHAGSYEISGICFRDGGIPGVPFIFSTNPQPSIHDCVFTSTSGTGATCAKDVIVLGGTGTTSGAGDTCYFQGYGGTVRNNYFDRIRHAVILQSAANSMQVHNNSIATTCGDSSAFGAPFIFNANPAAGSVGCQIHDNLVEAVHYTAVARANVNAAATYNTIGPNGVWDTTYVTQFAAMDSTSTGNMVNGLVYNTGLQEAAYDPSFTTAVAGGTRLPSVVTALTQFTTPPVVRLAGTTGTGFQAESAYGGRACVGAYGPASHPTSSYPAIAQIVTFPPTQVLDGITYSGSPYISSATAAFGPLDYGAFIASYTAAITAAPGTKIVFHATNATPFWTWQPGMTVPLGYFAIPVTPNGHLYAATTAGTNGSSAPTWPTAGGTVTDGTTVWQDLGTAATGAVLSAAATASTSGNALSFGRVTSGTAQLYFQNHHIGGSGTQPSWVAQAAAGAGAAITRTGYDIGQQVSLTTGTGSTAGLLAIGTPGNTMSGYSNGIIAVSPVNVEAAGLGLYGDLHATNTWKVSCVTAPADSTLYVFNIITLG
jgi:hypothetical protein